MVNEQRFQVGVSVVFAGLVVLVVFAEGSEFLQPLVDVLEQSAFVVVDVDSGGDVHGGDQDHPVFDAGLFEGVLDLRGQVDVGSPAFGVQSQVFGMAFHAPHLSQNVEVFHVKHFVMYYCAYRYIRQQAQMERMNRVGRGRKPRGGKIGQRKIVRRKIVRRKIARRKIARLKIGNLKASAEAGGEVGEANRTRLRLWRMTPKKRVTMYLDADVLAWFKEKPKYQGEINRVLRELMEKGADME